MFKIGTENPWLCHYGFNMFVDFCIWVLESDGLHVSPFDQHSTGDGTLQAAGLDAEEWRSWVSEVVNLQYQQDQALRQPFIQHANEWWRSLQAQGKVPLDPQSETFKEQALALGQQFITSQPPFRSDMLMAQAHNPPSVWTGNGTVGKRLEELWEQYRSISNKRREWERRLTTQWRTHPRGDGTSRGLWDALEPYRNRLDALFIHFVEYSQEVDYLVPPVSIIMPIVNGHLDGEVFLRRVLRATEQLVASSSS